MSFTSIIREYHEGQTGPVMPSIDYNTFDIQKKELSMRHLAELSVHVAKTTNEKLHPILASFSANVIVDESPVACSSTVHVRESGDGPLPNEPWIGGCMLEITEDTAIPVLFYRRDDVLHAYVPNAPLWYLYHQLSEASSSLSEMERAVYGSWSGDVLDARTRHAAFSDTKRLESRERRVVRPLASVAHHMCIAGTSDHGREFEYFVFAGLVSPSVVSKAGNVVFDTKLPTLNATPQDTPAGFGSESMMLLASAFRISVDRDKLINYPCDKERALPRWPFEGMVFSRHEWKRLANTDSDHTAKGMMVLVHDIRSNAFRYATCDGKILDLDSLLHLLMYNPPRYIIAMNGTGGDVFSYNELVSKGVKRERASDDGEGVSGGSSLASRLRASAN